MKKTNNPVTVCCRRLTVDCIFCCESCFSKTLSRNNLIVACLLPLPHIFIGKSIISPMALSTFSNGDALHCNFFSRSRHTNCNAREGQQLSIRCEQFRLLLIFFQCLKISFYRHIIFFQLNEFFIYQFLPRQPVISSTSHISTPYAGCSASCTIFSAS